MLPDEIARLPFELEKMLYELQDRIMSDVVRRLKKTGEITSTADYQLNKYLILGGTTEQIESEIKRLTGMTDAEVWEVYDRVVEKDYTRFKSIYEQVNGEFLQYEDNPELQDWVTATVQQTQREIKNITQSMGFTVDMGGGKKAFTPLSMYYQKYLDRACLDVVTGSFDYGSVLRRVTKEMAASGLQSVPYASGHVSNSIVAARRALLTGVNQLSAKINEKVGKELNAEYFEVTAHENARPSHAEWQGRVYTRRQLEEVCGLGSVTGLCGANCRHAYYAFIPGVSQRAYTDEYLEKLAEDEAKTKTWNGREYNAYERTQKQRQYESDMRKQRAYIKALKAGGADPKDIQAAQARYTNTLHEYQAFSAKMGLKEQLERVYEDGLGRMTGGRVPKKAALPTRAVQKEQIIEKTVSHEKVVEEKAATESTVMHMIPPKIENKTIEKTYTSEEKDDIIKKPDTSNCQYGTKKEYQALRKEHNKLVDKETQAQIMKHKKPDGSPGGYVATHNYSNINSNLREDGWTGNQLDADDIETIKSIGIATEKCQMAGDKIVTRYVNADYLTHVFGITDKSGGVLANARIDAQVRGPLKVDREGIFSAIREKLGTTYPEKGIISASYLRDKNIMTDKPVRITYSVVDGTHCYLPKNARESEVLFYHPGSGDAPGGTTVVWDSVQESIDGKIEIFATILGGV